MVTKEATARVPKSALRNDGASASSLRRTRAKSKVPAGTLNTKGKNEDNIVAGNEGTKKDSPVENIRMEGKRKGKPLSPAIVDVVFGRGQTSSPNEDELNRKRQEDTVRCGRVVRTVTSASNDMHSQKKRTTQFQENDIQTNVHACSLNESGEPSKKTTAMSISPDLNKQRQATSSEFCDVNDKEENPVFMSTTESASAQAVQQHRQRRNGKRGKINHVILKNAMPNIPAVEKLTLPMSPSLGPQNFSRSPSPIMYSPDKRDAADNFPSNVFTKHARAAGKERTSESLQRSVLQDSLRTGHRMRSRSPRQSPRRCNAHPRPDCKKRIFQEDEDQDNKRRLLRQSSHDIGRQERQYYQERLPIRRNDYAVYENRYKQRTSFSPDLSNKYLTRMDRSEKSMSPSLPWKKTSEGGVFEVDSGEENVQTKELAILSSSVDRRTRRYKVAVREAEGLERKKGGKKPFYLTLNSDGIPYGPGKPAWIAEVNKLAVGLDPSCTHIRKQTHEAMCIVKERLDDHFEYSGQLNQDHLRGLLGKAVTRKRTELITLINDQQDRPITIDEEVWLRLQKLASSRQRKNRTEIGRYANACRQTFGRTGAIGEDGVRQRLAERYGRSPDPDEVVEEMERDKGYSKRDVDGRRMRRRQIQAIDNYVSDDRRNRLRPIHFPVEEYSSEGTCNKRVTSRTLELEGKLPDVDGGGNNSDSGEENALDSQKMSTEEYIALLEAQVRNLKGDSGTVSSSHELVLSHSSRRTREDNDGRAVKNVSRTYTEAESRRWNQQ